MNILIVTDIARQSHSVRPELHFFLCWAKWGHSLTICTPPTDYQTVLDEHSIRVIPVYPKNKISPATISTIRNELKSHSYDIVFATNSKTIPAAAFACIGIDIKLACYRGTVSGLYRADPTSYLTVLHPRIDAVTCVSTAVEHHVRKQLWNKNVATCTILKGHKLAWYSAEQKAELEQFGIPDGAFTVVAIANFRRKKGLEVLIEAARLLADLKSLHILVVGSNSDKPIYEKFIETNPMRERIHRTGFREDALNILAASTMLVQASTGGEGLPRTVVEALALGIPPIVTTTGGSKEIIEHNKNGFIVDVNDAPAIAEHVRRCYENLDYLDRMRLSCTETIEKKLSADQSARLYLDFFDSLLNPATP